MVFEIPEDRPNPANEAVGNILGLLEQNQGARELASLMGLNRREFAAKTPQVQQFQMQQYLQNQQMKREIEKDRLKKNQEISMLANLLGLQMPDLSQPLAQEPVAMQAQPLAQEPVAAMQMPLGTQQQASLLDQLSDERLALIEHQFPKFGQSLRESKKMQREEQRATTKTISESYKESKDYRADTTSKNRAAKTDLARLDRMEALDETGKLDSGAWVSFLDSLGFKAALSPESQEFEKLVSDFTANIKDRFGARISDLDLKVFLQSIPTLQNSKEGRQRIYKTLRDLRQIEIDEYNVMRDIVKDKQNKGQPLPFDLQEEVADRMESSYDKFSKEFKEDYGNQAKQGLGERVNLSLSDGRTISIPKEQEAKFRAKYGRLVQ